MSRLPSRLGWSVHWLSVRAAAAAAARRQRHWWRGWGTGRRRRRGPALVTVSGTASPHPLTAGRPPPTDFSMMAVAVVDPSTVLVNPSAPPLQGGPLNTMTSNCPAGPVRGALTTSTSRRSRWAWSASSTTCARPARLGQDRHRRGRDRLHQHVQDQPAADHQPHAVRGETRPPNTCWRPSRQRRFPTRRSPPGRWRRVAS